jgi:hypothetical protein
MATTSVLFYACFGRTSCFLAADRDARFVLTSVKDIVSGENKLYHKVKIFPAPGKICIKNGVLQ